MGCGGTCSIGKATGGDCGGACGVEPPGPAGSLWRGGAVVPGGWAPSGDLFDGLNLGDLGNIGGGAGGGSASGVGSALGNLTGGGSNAGAGSGLDWASLATGLGNTAANIANTVEQGDTARARIAAQNQADLLAAQARAATANQAVTAADVTDITPAAGDTKAAGAWTTGEKVAVGAAVVVTVAAVGYEIVTAGGRRRR